MNLGDEEEGLGRRSRNSFLGMDLSGVRRKTAERHKREAERAARREETLAAKEDFWERADRLQEEMELDIRALGSHMDYEKIEPVILRLGKRSKKKEKKPRKPTKPPEILDSECQTWYKDNVGEEPPKPPEESLERNSLEAEQLDSREGSGYKPGVGEDSPRPTTFELEKAMSENTNEENTNTGNKEAASKEPGFGKRLWSSIWDNKGKIAAGAAVGVAVGVGGTVMMDRRAAKKAALREAAEQVAMSQAE